jgi:hypothetical protein
VWLVGLACAGLFAATGLAFRHHQRHLDALRQARDAVVANVPRGSLVICQGSLFKIVGTPLGVPEYRLRPLESEDGPADESNAACRDLDRELRDGRRQWYLAILERRLGERSQLTEAARALVERYRMVPLPVESPLLSLYVARPELAAVR